MFVFAFEGALFALTYNGDSLVLFALLPRLNPRTSVSAAALLFKELNLTTGGYSDSLVPFDRWHGFMCIVAVAPLPYINPSKCLLGFTVENFSVPNRLTAALVLRWGAALSGRAFSSSRYRAPLFSI